MAWPPAVTCWASSCDVGGAAAGVDVAPVGGVGDDGDVGAEAPEDLGGDAMRGAVGAVQEHVDAAEVEVLEAGVQLAQVVLVGAAQLAHVTESVLVLLEGAAASPAARCTARCSGCGADAVGASPPPPLPAPRASSASIACSSSSLSLKPSAAKNLMPLSW